MLSVSSAVERLAPPSSVLLDLATVPSSNQFSRPNANSASAICNTKAPCSAFGAHEPSANSWRIAHDGSSSGSSSICGKRFRSNSSSSSGNASDSDSVGSSANSVFNTEFADSPATSLSGVSAQDSDEDAERLYSSPSAGKRKAARRCWRDGPSSSAQSPMSAAAQRSTDGDSAFSQSQTPPSSISPSNPPPPPALSDDSGLGRAVQAFVLNSREPSPESKGPTNRVATPSAENDSASSSPRSETSPRKNDLVDHLVDAAVATIEAIWNPPPAHGEVRGATPPCTASALPLPLFIRETLRRSRTSCSTLQAALLYCLRCAPAVRQQRVEFQQMLLSQQSDAAARDVSDQSGLAQPLLCGRRIFLASVMVASKFLQDKTFSNKGWNRMTGLPLKQLACVERAFLKAINWDLNIRKGEWEHWVQKLAPAHKSVSRVQRSSDERQDRSGSLTPTASQVRPRSNLVRIHSDDGPLNAFDASLAANSTPDRRGNAGIRDTVVTDGGSAAATSAAVTAPAADSQSNTSTASQRGSPPLDVSGNAQSISAAPTNMARPFPMPRAFVRSSHSFSSTASRLTAMDVPSAHSVGAGSEPGQPPRP